MKKYSNGYTLIELMVVIVIIAIVAGYFSFKFSGFLDTIKLRSAARAVAVDLRSAQMSALAQHTEKEIIFNAHNYTKDEKTRSLPSAVSVANPQKIIFGATGMPKPGNFGTVILSCHGKTISIIISSAGRIRIE